MTYGGFVGVYLPLIYSTRLNISIIMSDLMIDEIIKLLILNSFSPKMRLQVNSKISFWAKQLAQNLNLIETPYISVSYRHSLTVGRRCLSPSLFGMGKALRQL